MQACVWIVCKHCLVCSRPRPCLEHSTLSSPVPTAAHVFLHKLSLLRPPPHCHRTVQVGRTKIITLHSGIWLENQIDM